jgi:hypothetical protein
MELFRKTVVFDWTQERQLAMERLKSYLTSAPTLISLDFSSEAGLIVLSVVASTTIGWGAILQQRQGDGCTKPARYESGLWSATERKYDAVKLECRGLLKALKKLRFWLFGRFFRLETDVQTLVWLLNQPPNNLLNALLTRWLLYIRLFDFEVKHVRGEKNGGPDALSRRGRAPEDEEEDENEVDEYFEGKMYSLTAESVSTRGPVARVWMLEGEYDGEDLMIGEYLETLERPAGLTDSEYQQLQRKAYTFFVLDGYLFKRGQRLDQPPRRVIGRPDQRGEVLRELHEETGHRGQQETFAHVTRRYQWKGMYEDCQRFVETCVECQRRAKIRWEEPLHPTWTTTVWEKVGLDVVHMPNSGGYQYIVFARDDLSGWVEGRALTAANSKNVTKFIHEDVIVRHGCPKKIVVDGGSENKGFVEELLECFKIRRIPISAYHLQSNGLVER